MRSVAVECHPTSVVHPGAVLGDRVRIGAYSVIGENVSIGRDTVIDSNVVIDGYTTIGERCRVFPFASIGLEPQDLKFRGEVTTLDIGDDNVFREFVTVHRGTELGGSKTVIGDYNLFMNYCHIAHDCIIGSHSIFANAATLAGHVEVDDYAQVGAHSGVHQFCRVGKYAFIGGYTVATKDVLPFSKTVGNRARLYGVNTIGLERRGFSKERIEDLKTSYRVLQQSGLNVSQAVTCLREKLPESGDAQILIQFIERSKRGVIVKRGSEPDASPETGSSSTP